MNEYLFILVIISAALLLSLLGLWFIAVIPGLDRWSKRFFQRYFSALMLSCVFGLADVTMTLNHASGRVFFYVTLAECLFLSLSLLMLTVYLAHCSGEAPRESRLLRAALGVWVVYFAVLFSALFIDGYTVMTAENQYSRGPLYPICVLPMVVLMLLNLAGTLRRRRRLSRKVYLGFLVVTLPMSVALAVQLFVDVFAFLDVCFIGSALMMYGFILSDQIEQDRRQQREIAHQRASILVLQMRPHFIYNTLMSIYSLINQDQQKARQVTADFTNYLRKNFNAVASESAVPFSAELEHTRAYLAVEQAQHEELLVVEYDTPFIRFRLPPLTLQPIVENAVKHGIDPYAGPLRVSVRTRQTEGGSEITVEDNGSGFDPADKSAPHPTLENIRARLEDMCGGTMKIEQREAGGTRVTIFVPTPKT